MLTDRLIEECDDCIEHLDSLISINTKSMRMIEMQEKLTNVWKEYTTKKLAKIFKEYMESLGANKYNRKKEDTANVYWIEGSSTNWHRTQCLYHKNKINWSYHNLGLILRKQAGSYFIVENDNKRVFECDHRGIVHFEEAHLNGLIEEHKYLFDSLFAGLKKKKDGGVDEQGR